MWSWLKVLSILAFAVLMIGYLNRRRPRLHIPCMLTAFVVDMAIVVYIEVTRDAIAAAKAKMGPLMIFHIALSVTVIVLYFAQIVTGLRKVRGRTSRGHGSAGLWLLLTRFGNLITSFIVTS